MIDPITLSIAIGAVLVSILTHIKFSKCMGFEISTRTPKASAPESPVNNENGSTALLLPSEHFPERIRAGLAPSEPINIPKREKIRNYL